MSILNVIWGAIQNFWDLICKLADLIWSGLKYFWQFIQMLPTYIDYVTNVFNAVIPGWILPFFVTAIIIIILKKVIKWS